MLTLILPPAGAKGEFFSLAPSDTVEGAIKTYTVQKGESLIEIARKFELGYNEITEANPGLDPFVPEEGATVTIPTMWILPDVETSERILINLSEFRLYYFFESGGSPFVETFPIGIGSEGHYTPVGEFKVTEKIANPAWHVPESIRLEKPELPPVVPPGPDNPLGTHALRLSDQSILIHGTNRPFAVGRMASHGCIRLYPEDIPILFTLVPNGVRVTIVRQPIKVGIQGDRVYLEVHNDPYTEVTLSDAAALLIKRGLLGKTDVTKLRKTFEKKDGIPTDISN
ncbi:L,D-transpeptidase family protein [Syntrophus gentianae]|uniref:L,D-transpeptidase family protein n=1 Tax=Syntrophus gentianae TaxID=43775 RepID=UPI001C312BB9|nr:L,D-transpeptidase family protein [Syntrophus gentianae]